jgi:hypothetical protein
MLSDEFFANLDSDPMIALNTVCLEYLQNEESVDNYLEAYAVIEVMVETNDMSIDMKNFDIDDAQLSVKIKTWINVVYIKTSQYIQSVDRTKALAGFRDKAKISIGKSFVYEFSDADYDRTQELINTLRDQFTKSTLFTPEHRQRLLKRLEKLQSEFHKKVSTLDGFFALAGEAGVVIGKFGKDVKPMVDTIKSITGIVMKTQAKAEGVPLTQMPTLGDMSTVDADEKLLETANS